MAASGSAMADMSNPLTFTWTTIAGTTTQAVPLSPWSMAALAVGVGLAALASLRFRGMGRWLVGAMGMAVASSALMADRDALATPPYTFVTSPYTYQIDKCNDVSPLTFTSGVASTVILNLSHDASDGITLGGSCLGNPSISPNGTCTITFSTSPMQPPQC